MTIPRTPDLVAAAHEVMLQNGFQPDFPPAVEREVSSLPEDPSPDAARAAGIRDLRGLLWSSIDNPESRDLDQVEYAEELPGGGAIRLLIGVADVDAFVPKGSATDEHAAANTTSVYTGVAVFPMLPERLSTDLTSLNEGEDRLAIVIELEVQPDGAVERFGAYRAMLHNRAKLDYESIGDWMDGGGPLPAKAAAIAGMEAQLRLQIEAARRLRGIRVRRGALSLDTLEPRPVVVDGKVIDIQLVPRNPARDLIESYMVAANNAAARYLVEQGSISIRRIVRQPKRWDRLVALAADLGESLPPQPDSVALNAFLGKRREADPEHFPDLSLSVVKLLGPGEYVLERRLDSSRQGDGHFGLAVADYVHSTAPNRRYPDLVTQRLIKGTQDPAPPPYTVDELTEIARRCTEREDAARKVERAMRKRAAAALMASRVGDEFVAVVTGASPKGTYVRVLRPPVEGRVIGGAQGLDVGDTVRVTLASVDADRGFIDFTRDPEGTERKLERQHRKRVAAERLRTRRGELFDAEVSGATPRGTWVRLLNEGPGAEGKVVRGYKGLAKGQRVRVRLVDADPVHGFIDFEFEEGIEPRKRERAERKRNAAVSLKGRAGQRFEAEVTGVTEKATWVRTVSPRTHVEGRLVRGGRGLAKGDRVRVVLLAADPQRGFIDFARE